MGRFGIKIVGLLLLISTCAFLISLVLVEDVLRVSTATMRGHARELEEDLRSTVPIYRQLIRTKKQLYDLRAQEIARSPHLVAAAWSRDRADARRALALLAKGENVPSRIAVRDSAHRLVASVGAPSSTGRRYRISEPIGPTDWLLVAEFPIDQALQSRFEGLGRKLDVEGPHLQRINRALQPRYFPVFVRFFGVAMLIVTVAGMLFARRMAQRVARLSRATRRVAAGDLEVRVPTKARDEIGQLSQAFNEMVMEVRRNRAQIAYLQKISAWQEVARRLAHEIKNPLTPILLAVQQVQQKYPGADPRFARLLDDASDIVKEEIDGLRRLVEAFSAFAKLPSVQVEPVAVEAVVEDALRGLGSLADRGSVVWSPPEPSFEVMVDRLLFRRVLHNLIENAIQVGEEAGSAPTVRLRVRRLVRSKVAVFTVSDNGPGVAEEIREQVFDPYFTTRDGGTGLGLAIVKKLILEHEGSIDLGAASEGGAEFTIRIPTA